mmetsp:Transcript_37615/g.55406  ORF Transcript_37615/g.55406 Transcript_37615/m.55406 type:complete len:179 (-) Transcript_37615:424-960(-)
MITKCDPAVASWVKDGDMFVIKNQTMFASHILPQHFNHQKYSSFARQLNFYNFRKIKSKPVRKADYDPITANYIYWHHEHFQQGRHDLLINIKRKSTGGNLLPEDKQKELDHLKEHVNVLQGEVTAIIEDFEGRISDVSNKFKKELASLLENNSGGIGEGGAELNGFASTEEVLRKSN